MLINVSRINFASLPEFFKQNQLNFLKYLSAFAFNTHLEMIRMDPCIRKLHLSSEAFQNGFRCRTLKLWNKLKDWHNCNYFWTDRKPWNISAYTYTCSSEAPSTVHSLSIWVCQMGLSRECCSLPFPTSLFTNEVIWIHQIGGGGACESPTQFPVVPQKDRAIDFPRSEK